MFAKLLFEQFWKVATLQILNLKDELINMGVSSNKHHGGIVSAFPAEWRN